MYYYIYKTTNLINNKYYVGAHQSKKLEDTYLGSGKALHNALKKYGKENFKREILFICNSKIEMFEKEAEIVNIDFISKRETYNEKIGGFGGFTKEAGDRGRITSRKKGLGVYDPKVIEKRNALNKQNKSGIYKLTKEEKVEIQKQSAATCKKLKLGIFSEESKRKAKERNRELFTGCRYLNNGSISKRAKKEEIDSLLSQGWVFGRLLTKPKLV